jgi:hypothetical protein
MEGLFQGADWSVGFTSRAAERVAEGLVDGPQANKAVDGQLRQRGSLPGQLHLAEGFRKQPRREVSRCR